MTSITNIPIKVIESFLKSNGVKIPINDKEIYQVAYNLIINQSDYYYPDIIIDWIIAHNLYNENRKIRTYSRGEIDVMSEKEVTKLAEKLEIFESPNLKQSIINVLKFLKKLETRIINPDIDSLIFQTLDELEQQKILNSDYKGIIEIFQKNKGLRKFIYDNLNKIIEKNSLNFKDLTYIKHIRPLINFIIKLMKIKEIALVKEILKIISKLLTNENIRSDIIPSLSFRIIYNNDEESIEDFFRLLPYINNLFPEMNSDEIITDVFNRVLYDSSSRKYNDTMISFLTAAIRTGQVYFINEAIATWIGYDGHKNQQFAEEMDKLIKEARQKYGKQIYHG